ncbi:hypothetical protein BA895_13475 [Humibacillus sp. DSM 29435]|uniref:sensor histidine kinase n=1 Tax=Humibacillus sp. DSM 29435 TaxID=1869167 RepID=UPI00087277BC|nr:histidine kinase [Humibacillus sp. DSM 29435]OFE17815.1 hypothetical protein BA895_13475 [Humibacillus sp. DSM 29435]
MSADQDDAEMNALSVREMRQPWNAVGSRLPMVASWAIIVALVVQESVSDLGPSTVGWFGLNLLGTIIAIATSLCYVVWQVRIVQGVSPSTTRRFVLLLTVGAWTAMLVDGHWAPLPLALSAVMLVFSPLRATLAAALMLVGLAVYVGLVVDPRLAVVMPPGILALAAVLYAFTRLSVVIRELQLAREELVRNRVDQERLRMQRALHDILGRTLVTASLRNQIALRTLDSDPRAAREHLEQLHVVVSDGQARLRAVTAGPVIVSLADEVESASTLCQRLGIEVTVDVGPLPSGVPEGEIGAVVRESVTNMLKHSRALHCSLTIRSEPMAVVVTVVNDGCLEGAPGAGFAPGTGLTHMREIVERAGGSFTGELIENRRFRVWASLPNPSGAPGPVEHRAGDRRDQT